MFNGIQSAQSSVASPPNIGSGSDSVASEYLGLNSFAKMAQKNPSAVSNVVSLTSNPSPTNTSEQVNYSPQVSSPPRIETPQTFIEPTPIQIPSTPIPDIPYQAPVIQAPAPQPLEQPIAETNTVAQTPNISLVQERGVGQTTNTGSFSIKIKGFIKWVVIVLLTGQGLKGLFDSLYFILVEFQNFEQALVDQLVETSLINQLILKASLLVFTTALSVFFALQLSTTPAKQLHLLKIFAATIVGVACFFVLQHANTIHVLDILKQ